MTDLRPLGRRVNHDPRSRAFRYRADRGVTYATVRHQSHIGILDQGSTGSCTGQATVGALACDPFHATLPAGTVLDEAAAVRLYSEATVLDPFDGDYPPNDTGSDGVSVAKAAQRNHLISGYQHAFTLADALAALQAGPFITGITWMSSFDEPDYNGVVTVKPTAYARGGHEICADEYNADRGMVGFRNSWGEGWGIGGRFYMTVATFAQLLADDGDVTVFVPATAPAPTPTPTDPALAAWWTASKTWSTARHVGSNAAAAKAAKALAAAKGLT